MSNAARFVLLLLVLLVSAAPVVAQKPHTTAQFEIRPDAPEASTVMGHMRISDETGVPLAIYSTDFRATAAAPEAQARQYLAAHADQLGISEALDDLVHVATRETPGGYRVRFEQEAQGYRVYHGQVAVSLGRNGEVLFVVNGYKPRLRPQQHASKMSADDALQIARTHLGVTGDAVVERSAPMWLYLNGRTQLVHRVHLYAPQALPGDWEVLVDAESGGVVKAWNRAPGHRSAHFELSSQNRPQQTVQPDHAAPASPPPPSVRVDGTGFVFDPDPLSVARAQHGGAYADNNDADSPELNAARSQVTLRDISFDGTTYALRGPYAAVTDWDTPRKGVFSQASPDWNVTRSDDAFEAVNVYYHVDQSMRYINETLGFDLMPFQYSGGVRIDPHGADGQDQSFYSPSDGSISMGEGGIDDAEDAHVTLHELGHGLHDWLTDGQISTNGDLAEGSSDYWAISYTRSLGHWAPTDEQYHWVFPWDGHNAFWSGRIANYAGRYPDDLIDGLYTDGQMWSSSLMEVYDVIGREVTDRLFLEALSMTGINSTQEDAALAFIQADRALHDGAHLSTILPVFFDRGYIRGARIAADVNSGTAPLTVAFQDQTILVSGDLATSWAWDFDGDGTVDATDANPTWTFTKPGLYTVTLTVSDGTDTYETTLEDFVSVNQGVYVWEGQQDQVDFSGAFIRDYLQANGYQTAYSRTAAPHTTLEGYDAVFLSFGQFASGNTTMTADMAQAVLDYLQAGGNVYLDGGEAFGFDQASNTPLLNAFGITSSDDGSDGPRPVRALRGQAGSIMDGLRFSASTQRGLTYVDRYTPRATGTTSMVENGYGIVGVEYDGTFGQKTFVLSYTLAALTDRAAPSTRADVLERVLAFFDVSPGAPTNTDTAPELPSRQLALEGNWPNPFEQHTTLGFYVPDPMPVTLTVYNALGQEVTRLIDQGVYAPGSHTIRFDAHHLPSGLYVAQLTAGDSTTRRTLLRIR